MLDVVILEENKYFWINLSCGRHISTLSEVWGLISCKACYVVDLSKYWHCKWNTEVNKLARRTGESPLSVVSIAQILYNTPTSKHGGYIFRWLPIFMFCSCCCWNSGPLFLLVKWDTFFHNTVFQIRNQFGKFSLITWSYKNSPIVYFSLSLPHVLLSVETRYSCRCMDLYTGVCQTLFQTDLV